MVAELGYTPTLCVPSEEQRFTTGQIEKELKEVMRDDGFGIMGYEEFLKMMTHKI